MSREPAKKYNVQDNVQTPIGLRKLLDIIPIKYGEQTVDWLYVFGEDYDEKFTGEELEQ
jgi:hypothetical protein